MSTPSVENLLAQLSGKGSGKASADTWAKMAATVPQHDRQQPAADGTKDAKLDQLLGRIAQLTGNEAPPKSAPSINAAGAEAKLAPVEATLVAEKLNEAADFVPVEPRNFRQAQVNETVVESLILKFLMSTGDAAGREIAEQVKLPFLMIEELLRQMKMDQLLAHRGSAPMNDFQFQLTDLGRERARRFSEHCTYYGSAPVALRDYIQSVAAQSLTTQQPTVDDLKRAFEDLLINPRMLARLGPAVNSGRGLFLYGAAGNGKTSIAERVTRAFGQYVWIPRAIGFDGEIMRLFDPSVHDEIPLDAGSGLLSTLKVDKRWVRIRRPTIIVGGELTMSALEVTMNTTTGISESPVQMKSNCGTLVIDDFGRQKMSTNELLNRWIVPLEKRHDYLNLANGKKIQVPFDQLVIFSTNLQPRDLVDEAFLRRIPYKIDVVDPTEDEFIRLFQIMAPKLGFVFRPDPIRYLIDTHFKLAQRPFRNCLPRDLMMQVRNYCKYQSLPLELTNEYFDLAVENYFAAL